MELQRIATCNKAFGVLLIRVIKSLLIGSSALAASALSKSEEEEVGDSRAKNRAMATFVKDV